MSNATSPQKAALTLLARREHSRAELIAKLKKQHFDESAILSSLDELANNNLQSDHRFSHHYAQARIDKGYGSYHIKQQLKQYQIDTSIIEEIISSTDWNKIAVIARQKKFGSALPKTATECAKQMRFLQYRGFSSDVIKMALQSDDHSN